MAAEPNPDGMLRMLLPEVRLFFAQDEERDWEMHVAAPTAERAAELWAQEMDDVLDAPAIALRVWALDPPGREMVLAWPTASYFRLERAAPGSPFWRAAPIADPGELRSLAKKFER